MSHEKERSDPAGGWEGLAEWTGGLPPEQIRALAAVRPLEDFHSLLRGLTGRTPRELLVRAAVLEALTWQPSSRMDALSWLTEPARGETLRALRRSGWLEPDPDESLALTRTGRQVWDALRRAAVPESNPARALLADVTPEQIVRALLARNAEELAEAGRAVLVPVLPAPPLLTTEAIARAAESQALAGDSGDPGTLRDIGQPLGPGGRRRR